MNYENKIKKYLSLFLIIQPILDIYWLFHIENISSVFVFSPSTIIRLLVFAVLFILFILDKKKFKSTFLFGLVCIIYFVFHHYVAMNSTFYKNDTYSLVSELFYIIRIAIPLYMIYMVSKYKFEDNYVEKIFYRVAFIFSFIMIITNLFLIALPAYPYTSYGIKGNIFYWFFARYFRFSAYELATKGIFNMANQISGTFILIFPILVYYLYKNYSFKKLVVVMMMILSMLMLGTRVSSYGVVITLLVLLCVYIFCNFKNLNKNLIILNILLIISSSLMIYFAPVSIREFYENSSLLFNELSEEDAIETKKAYDQFYSLVYSDSKTKDEEIDYLAYKYREKIYLPTEYFKLYPISDDPDFWNDYIKNRTQTDNRSIENAIIKRLDSLYSNKKTKLFGHSYTKTFNNGFYLEKDYVYQYYALGIVGLMIFFLPYFIIVGYASFKILLDKSKFNMKNITYIYSIALLLLSAYKSGNVMDTFIDTIFLAFICGLLLSSLRSENNMNNKVDYKKDIKVSVIVPVYNVEDYIERCLLSIVNQTLDGVELIVVNDGSKDSSIDIIRNIQEQFPDRIKVIDKVNEGVSIARNTGIKEARGEYIGFVDSDDWIEPTMYEKLYNKAKSEDLDVVACDCVAVYPDKNLEISSNLSQTPDNKELFINAYAVIWNKIYKRELIADLKFKPNVWYEDVLYLYMLYPRLKKVGVVKEVLYNYLQREGSITYTYNEKLYQLIENMDDMVKYYKENGYMDIYKDEVEYSYVRYLYGTFIKRLAKSKDKKEYNRGVEYVIGKVKETFPNYKKNKYIKKLTPKNMYFKLFGKNVANIIFIKEKNRAN